MEKQTSRKLFMKNTQLMEYSVPQGVKATKTALILPQGMTPDDWVQLGYFLRSSEDSLGIWQADWRKHGYENYERSFVDGVVGQLEFHLHGVEKLELYGQILPEHRHETLSNEHYLIAAKRLTDPKERETWLFTAQSEGLSPRELQASIRAHEVIRIEMDKRQVSLPSPYAARAEYRAWRKELGEAWQQWTKQDFLDVAETMKEMAECYSWLLNMAEKAPHK
jgi:hypothetical protein